MKILAAALAGALVAGTAVYVWREAELDSRQARLLRMAQDKTYAEIQAERLAKKLETVRQQVNRLRRATDRAREDVERQVAPPLSTEPDGRYFGFIDWVDLSSEPQVAVMDFAEFLSGAKAQAAAEEAGAIEPGEPVSNDYYISNVNPMLRTLELAPDVKVIISTGGSTGGPEPRPMSLTRWARLLTEADGIFSGLARNGYWITMRDGTIVRLAEQWVP